VVKKINRSFQPDIFLLINLIASLLILCELAAMYYDDKERGFDKEIRKYFRKVIYSISWGLILLMSALTLGIYHKLAFIGPNPVWYNILFYSFFLAGLIAFIFYLIRTWKNGGR
jgi:hypothetical protein